MAQIRISGKNLGELKLGNFCERCFWIKLHCENKLPFMIFPGIFSSIDSYTKKITNVHFDRHTKLPKWFDKFGISGEPKDVPGYRKFSVHDQETDILLTGVPDEILYNEADESYLIVDYKTARYTETQDKLLPMYEVQLNAYAYIGDRVGFKPVTGLALLYYEPQTEVSDSNIDSFTLDDGFSMNFSGHLKKIKLNTSQIPTLLQKVRTIYDKPNPPTGLQGCKDCELLDGLVQIATT